MNHEPQAVSSNAFDIVVLVASAGGHSAILTILRLLSPQWVVELAANGEAALAAALRVQPDVILTDVTMSGQDGFALIQGLRADARLKYIPVVLLTTRAGEEAAIQGLLAGADDYIAKPFSPRELVARIQAVIERTDAEAALRASEEKYRTLFETIDEAFCLFEVIPDAQGRVVDLIYREGNQSFARQSGLRGFLGKRTSEVLPNLEQELLDVMTGIYQTGTAVRAETAVADLGRWYNFHYSRVGDAGSRFIAAVFEEITERKNAERRQAFLLKLSDLLQPIKEPIVMQAAAMQLLGEELDVMRATYMEVAADGDTIELTAHYEKDAPPFPDQSRISDVTAAHVADYRNGRTVILYDTENEPQPEAYRAVGVRAAVAVPLVKNGQLVAIVGVNSASPRNWTNVDVQLLEALAERTWTAVERAKAEAALRVSEERMQLAMRTNGMVTWEWLPAEDRIRTSDSFAGLYGLPALAGVDEGFALVVPEEREAHLAKVRTIAAEGGSYTSEFRIRWANDGRVVWIEERCEAQLDARGRVARVIGVAIDITQRKAAEAALQKNAQRMRGQKEAFQAAINGAPLADVLVILTRLVTAETAGAARSAFYLADANYQSLHPIQGAGSMPDSSIIQVDWSVIGVDSLATGRPVLTRDVFAEPIWAPWVHLAEAYDFRGCWSFPIHSVNSDQTPGKLIGTFAMYFTTVRDAQPDELALAEVVTQTAGIILARHSEAQERARAEEALRASEARIRIAAEAAQMATWEWHLRTNEIYWNDQHFLLFGMNPLPTPMQPSDFFEHVHPDDQGWLAARLQAAVVAKGIFEAEFRSITQSGALRWMSGYGRVMTEVDGVATRMNGVMFDITERKMTDEALRMSEARQASILETMAEGVVTIDQEGRFFSVNAAAERILGVSRSELVGRANTDPPYRRFALSGEPWGDHPPFAEVAAAGRQIFQDDYIIERPDGLRVVITRNITGVRTADGALLGFVSTLSDITAQKRVEAALRDSEERFRTVANLVPDLLWSSEADGYTGWYNQRWLEYTGQTLEQAIDWGWADAIHPDDRAASARRYKEAIDTGIPLRQEHRIKRYDGTYRWFVIQAQPIKDTNERILFWYGAATDIHEQRIVRETLERHVQERTHELATLSAIRQSLLDRLLTAQEDERRRIAHDLHDSLGQYLVALNVGLKTIQEIDGFPPPVATRIDALRTLVLNLDEEVERLAFALRPLALDDLGLADALQRHVALWKADSQIAVDMHLQGLADVRLPPAVETAIFRIVQEALTNIRKYAEASHVSLIVEQRAHEVLAIIEDNGCGFVVATGLAEPDGRLHLGLSGMRERAQLSGSQLEVESAPGAGTTLYLHIPIRDKKGDNVS